MSTSPTSATARERRQHSHRRRARLLQREQAKLDGILLGSGSEDPARSARAAGDRDRKVGIFRRGTDLEAAVDELQKLVVRSQSIGVDRGPGRQPELVTAYRTKRMLVALSVAYGALMRTEAEARIRQTTCSHHAMAEAHARHLEERVRHADARLRVTRRQAHGAAAGGVVTGEGLHRPPETAARQAEVDAAKEKYGDRFERQRALMPLRPAAEAGSRAATDRRLLPACGRKRAGVDVCLGSE